MIINSIRKYKLFFCMVIVPMALAIVYFVVLASNRYISSAEVVVHKIGSDSGSDSAQLSGLAALMGGGGSTGGNSSETLYVKEFIVSQDMLNELQNKLHWRQHYQGRMGDPWYYLPADASQEQVLKYYQRMVTARFDQTTGLLTIQVQAFDRAFADQTVATIISASDRFVNEISHRLAREQVNFAEIELERSRLNFREKQKAMLDFQADNNVLDAQQAAADSNSVISGLRAQLTKENAALRAMRVSLNEDSPQIRRLKIQIEALQQQIVSEERQLIANSANGKLNVVASRFHGLELDTGIAEDSYKASVASLQSARISATKKLRSLVVVVSPNMPDEALFPRRLYSLFTILICLLLIYGITEFVIATINDHKD